MARSVRIEYAGAYYHVMARENRREAIFFDDDDRRFFLQVLAELGLRTHEVSILALNDLDWSRSILHLRETKQRRERLMPLPQISDTYWYLTAIPELLRGAGQHFQSPEP